MADLFDLERFVAAQNPVYGTVKAELAAGRKTTHWIWFIFPQIAGLGHSANAQHFALRSLDEARAYFAHPVLGPRLVECTRMVCSLKPVPIGKILPHPDDLKFQSSMTLFSAATGDPLFSNALDDFFAGQPDEVSRALIGARL